MKVKMKKSKEAKIISIIAKRNGISEKEVRDEMQAVIDMAMANNDPTIKAKREKLFENSEKPSPEEFTKIISEEIKNS